MNQFAPGPDRRVAVLVDAENVSATHWAEICSVVSAFGRMTLLACVGDFSGNHRAGWRDICRQAGGKPVMTLASDGCKNGADIALTIEAMELMYVRAADTFVLVSGDSDFAALGRKITASGFISVGIGLDTTPAGLRCAFERFFALGRVTPASKPAPPAPALSQEQQALLGAVVARLAQKSGGTVLLGELGKTIRAGYPALASLLGKGRLRKALRRYGLVEESGSGADILVRPRRIASVA